MRVSGHACLCVRVYVGGSVLINPGRGSPLLPSAPFGGTLSSYLWISLTGGRRLPAPSSSFGTHRPFSSQLPKWP